MQGMHQYYGIRKLDLQEDAIHSPLKCVLCSIERDAWNPSPLNSLLACPFWLTLYALPFLGGPLSWLMFKALLCMACWPQQILCLFIRLVLPYVTSTLIFTVAQLHYEDVCLFPCLVELHD
jgi:hypothetical protein